MSEFLSLNLTATLLGVSLRSIQREIKTGKYTTRQVSGRGGKRYEIALSSLPKEAQEKLQQQHAQNALIQLNQQVENEVIPQAEIALIDYVEQQKILQKTREMGLAQFALLPKEKKSQAKAKERLLMALYQFMRRTNLKKRPAIERFCGAVNRGIGDDVGASSVASQRESVGTINPSTGSGRMASKLVSFDSSFDASIDEAIHLHPAVKAIIPVRFGVQYLSESTLKQWLYGYEREGIIALVSEYSNCGRRGVIDDHEELKRYVLGFMLKYPMASASKVKAALGAQKSELDVVHEQTIARYMTQWKKDNAQLWTFITHPDKWKNVYMPAYGSHSEGIERLNQLWEMDSTPGDWLLTDGRHSVLGVIDLYSRRMVFFVSKTSSAKAVGQAFRKAVLYWGVPERIRTDNGKDYVSDYFSTALVELEIVQDLCIPFASEEKGTIERSLGTMSHGLMELLPGFAGHNVTQAQQIRGMKSFAQRIMTPGEVVEVSMTAAELQATLDKWAFHVYGQDSHSGLSGRSPNEQASLYSGSVRRISSERALDMLLAETAATRILGKNGIRFNGRDYIAPELTEYAGKPAVLKYDESDIGRLYVYVGNAFICVAECAEITGISRREVAVVSKKHIKKHLTAQARELKEFKKDIDKDIVNKVIEHRIEMSESVRYFPRPALEHSTPALEQAGLAAGETKKAEAFLLQDGSPNVSDGEKAAVVQLRRTDIVTVDEDEMLRQPELKRIVHQGSDAVFEQQKLKTYADLLAERGESDEKTLSRAQTIEKLYGQQ